LKPRFLPLLTLIGLLILTGGVLLFFGKVAVLEIINLDHHQVLLVRVSPSERFSMFYVHSIYDADVVEEFEVGSAAILLRGVRTENPRVMEYYGFDSVKGFHPLNLEFKKPLIIKRGMGQEQGFVFKGENMDLGELAEKGDRIQLRLTSVSWWAFISAKLSEALPTAPKE